MLTSRVRFNNLDYVVTGGMGRMESIQSDSSGFAEGDTITDHQARDAEDRVGRDLAYLSKSILIPI